MRLTISTLLRIMMCACLAATSLGQDATVKVAAAPGAPSAAPTVTPQSTPFTYILFYRQNDVNTQQFAETIRNGVARKPDQANWTSVDISDEASKEIVAKYGVSRAPMPLALCVADNGAITAVFPRRPNDAALDRAIVTPAMVTATKALQDKKIVVVHVKATNDAPLPYGAFEFANDLDFKERTMVVDVVASDAKEQRFLTDMEFNPSSVRESSVVIMAPPAVLVGKFAATATRDDIAAKLHAAGKCCNDPNCKHNKAQAK